MIQSNQCLTGFWICIFIRIVQKQPCKGVLRKPCCESIATLLESHFIEISLFAKKIYLRCSTGLRIRHWLYKIKAIVSRAAVCSSSDVRMLLFNANFSACKLIIDWKFYIKVKYPFFIVNVFFLKTSHFCFNDCC